MSRIVLSGIGDLGEKAALDTNPDRAVGSDDVLVAMEAAPINPGPRASDGW